MKQVQTEFSSKVSFKRDVGIVWKKRERNPKDEDESDLSRGHWENKGFKPGLQMCGHESVAGFGAALRTR